MLTHTLTMLILALTTFHSAEAQEMPGMGPADPSNPIAFSGETQFLDIEEQRGQVAIPVYKGEKNWSWIAVRGQRVLFDKPIVFQDRNVEIPQEIGSLDVSGNFAHQNLLGETTTYSASYGTSGRSLFNADNVRTITANYVTESKDGINNWIFGLNYSNNRTILNNIPIPIVAYAWNFEKSKVVLGAPFLFGMWRPMPLILVGMASPFFAMTEASYFVYGPIQLHAGLAWLPRVFQSLDSADRNQRFFYEKFELTAGVRIPLSRTNNVSLSYVVDTNRQFYLGQSRSEMTSAVVSRERARGIQLKAKFSF
jgi:hypothetical protein